MGFPCFHLLYGLEQFGCKVTFCVKGPQLLFGRACAFESEFCLTRDAPLRENTNCYNCYNCPNHINWSNHHD